MNKQLISFAIALCGIAGGAFAVDAPISKDAYKAEKDKIEAQAKADKKACGTRKANAKDVCELEAKGKEKVARAELEARLKPSPEADKEAKTAKADAEYAVAKQKCEDAKGSARDACVQRAKGEREAAVRLAKIEKVESVRDTAKAAAAARKHLKPENSKS